MRGIREGWRDGGIERGSKKVGVEVRGTNMDLAMRPSMCGLNHDHCENLQQPRGLVINLSYSAAVLNVLLTMLST